VWACVSRCYDSRRPKTCCSDTSSAPSASRCSSSSSFCCCAPSSSSLPSSSRQPSLPQSHCRPPPSRSTSLRPPLTRVVSGATDINTGNKTRRRYWLQFVQHAASQYYGLLLQTGVAWSVCHDRESCKNGWTDRDVVWDVNSGGRSRTCPVVDVLSDSAWTQHRYGMDADWGVLDGVHTGATRWIRLSRPWVGDASFHQNSLTTYCKSSGRYREDQHPELEQCCCASTKCAVESRWCRLLSLHSSVLSISYGIQCVNSHKLAWFVL